MNLINEYRDREAFAIPGDCNKEFQSLMRQIGDYCSKAGKGTGYRVAGLFLIQFLLDKHIITRGEDRDLTVHYTKEEAVEAVRADKMFLTLMGPVDRTIGRGGNVEVFNDKVKGIKPEVTLPSAEWEKGSSIGISRPVPKAKKHTTEINKFVENIIATDRFNCSHVKDFINYAQIYLRGYNTDFKRGGLEGQQLKDKQGYDIAGKTIELKDFIFNPNYTATYATTKSLSQQSVSQAAVDKEILLKNPDIAYLFFVAYYIPTFISIYTDYSTEKISELLLSTKSIEEFEKYLENERKVVNTLRLKELATGGDETEELEDLEDRLKMLKFFISNVEDYKKHTKEYMLGIQGDISRIGSGVSKYIKYENGDEEDINLYIQRLKDSKLTPTESEQLLPPSKNKFNFT